MSRRGAARCLPGRQSVEIVEVLGPSQQGMARPYLCRGEDGACYYVKSRQSGRRSLWCEWICGHLAQGFGLNLPPFRLTHIGNELLAECPPEWRELGSGVGFGSQSVDDAAWMEPAMLADVSAADQQEIALFDWWVHNLDRQVGNTNLLWDARNKRAVVIDFNNAFDPDFSAEAYRLHHMFLSQLGTCFADLVTEAEFAQRLNAGLDQLQAACDTAPEEWHWTNPEMDVPYDFDIARTTTLLRRFLDTPTWRL